MKGGTVGLDLMTDQDAADVARIAGDRDLGKRMRGERDDGTGYGFVIRDRGEIRGVGVVRGVGEGVARDVACVVDAPMRGQGLARFALEFMLDFAFRNLRLQSVVARESADPAWRRVLDRTRFDQQGRLSAAEWAEFRDGPNLAALHPGLRSILAMELAAGNDVMETGRGWPDADSVFVRLREPFQGIGGALPEGVRYADVNDPHWWRAEYHTEKPKHLLVC